MECHRLRTAQAILHLIVETTGLGRCTMAQKIRVCFEAGGEKDKFKTQMRKAGGQEDPKDPNAEGRRARRLQADADLMSRAGYRFAKFICGCCSDLRSEPTTGGVNIAAAKSLLVASHLTF